MYRRLKRDHQKFRGLFDQAPNAVALADINGIIRQVNGSFKKLFGFSREETIGEDIDNLLTQSADAYKQAKQITNRLRSGEVLQEKTKRFDKDGNKISVILSALPITIDGKITHYFAVYTDVTHLKRLEEKNRKLLEEERKLRAKAEQSREQFREMFDIAPAAIALLEGPRFTYTYANQAYKEQLPDRNIIGNTMVEVVPEAKESGYIEQLKEVYETGRTYKN